MRWPLSGHVFRVERKRGPASCDRHFRRGSHPYCGGDRKKHLSVVISANALDWAFLGLSSLFGGAVLAVLILLGRTLPRRERSNPVGNPG